MSIRGARILVLDGDTTQALAVVRSLARSGHRVVVASVRRRPLAAWSRFCAEHVQLSTLTPGAFDTLRRWAERHRIEVVLPLTERSCVLLNLGAEAWRTAGIVLGCGSARMLDAAFDKAETVRRAIACGVAVPRTVIPLSRDDVDEAARALRPPWVVKARHSHAWLGRRFLPDLGVAYVDRLARLAPVADSRRQGEVWPIIQEFVAGKGKGVFALCDHGRVVRWFAHERLRDVRPSGSGSSLRRSIALDPRLRAPAETLLGALDWHGPAMLEFRDDGHGPPALIEINGRFWGSLQLAISAGVDFPGDWVRILLGGSVDAASAYEEGVIVRWMWGDVKRLVHLVRGAPPGFPGRYPPLLRGLRDLFGPQPRGTRHETWDREDPWPVVAEWVEGISSDLLPRLLPAPRRTAAPEPLA